MIIVPTVRHSGSHFVVKLLGYDINQTLSWKSVADHATPDSLVFDHISPFKRDVMLPLIEQHETVIPIRHPFLTAKSWDDRKKDKHDLIESWLVLANEIAPYEPHYLPLDVPDRQEYLDAFNEATGRSISTDWKPEGVVQNNSALRWVDVDPSPEIVDLCDEIKPFLDRFYK